MTETTKKSSGMYLSVRWLLLISFSAMFTLVIAGIFYWFYDFSTKRTLEQISEDLTQTVQMAALNIDTDELLALYEEGQPNEAGLAWENAIFNGGDLEAVRAQYGQPQPNGFSDDPRYQKLMDWLETVHGIEPRAWPYIWVNDTANQQAVYVADLSARYNPEKSTLFLEWFEDPDPYTQLTLSTNESGKLTSYEDPWGEWYSAWLPLTDSQGQIIGVVGIDFEAGEIRQVQASIRNTILMAFAFTYFIIFLAIFWISGRITSPIISLTRAADAIGEGNYDLDIRNLFAGSIHNEVDTLARVFNVMLEKVRERVVKLQQQVTNLRIEIDEAKRKQQVEDIASSDFFRDLQTKASNFRKKDSDKTAKEEGGT
ncbi:MAG: HAMP domain-containing protein [Anaerolineales bacterium]|nr:HAMP domain-containing protein [Anaerolineales bacterium]